MTSRPIRFDPTAAAHVTRLRPIVFPATRRERMEPGDGARRLKGVHLSSSHTVVAVVAVAGLSAAGGFWLLDDSTTTAKTTAKTTAPTTADTAPAPSTATATATSGTIEKDSRCVSIRLELLAPFVAEPDSLELVEAIDDDAGFRCEWSDGQALISFSHGGLTHATPYEVLIRESMSGVAEWVGAEAVVVVPRPDSDSDSMPDSTNVAPDRDAPVTEARYVASGQNHQLGYYGSIVRVTIRRITGHTSATEVLQLAELLTPLA